MTTHGGPARPSRARRVAALAGLAALGWARTSRAQADSIASMGVEVSPYARTGFDPRLQVGSTAFRVALSAPIVLGGGRTILLPGVSYERLEFTGRAPDTLGRPPQNSGFGKTLHAPMVTFTAVHAVTRKLSLIASVNEGFASDFQSRDSLEFLFVGRLIGIYKLSDQLSLGAGVGYDRRTGQLTPIPLLPINWQFTPRWRVRGTFPAFLGVDHRASSWLTASLRGAFEGNRFYLSSDEGRQNLQLAISTISVGPRLTFDLHPFLHLDVYTAVPVYRRYEAFLDNRSVFDASIRPVVTYGLRLWV
ncbi:MAG: hypothetical protein EOO74_01585, partial [Myxococcales bacterium]